MNDKNKQINIRTEVEQGKRSLKEAQVLLQQELFEGAISRSYYAAFHYTLAVLLTLGFEPKSHEGALHLFNLNFVKAGIIEPEFRTILKKAQKWRLESDYKRRLFEKEEAELEIKEVMKFIDRISLFLKANGYIKS